MPWTHLFEDVNRKLDIAVELVEYSQTDENLGEFRDIIEIASV